MDVQGKVWGKTIRWFSKNNVEIHQIYAKKGGFCSKHRHSAKYNKFIILEGKLAITRWSDYGSHELEDVTILNAGEECTAPPGEYHRFEALEDTIALEVYWVELDPGDIDRECQGGAENING